MKTIPDFSKSPNGLLPAIIQDIVTDTVLMLGYMNAESFTKTIEEGKVCFYSRSRKTLWTKGETSGNFLFPKEILIDCDQDTILIKATPAGPVCHTGSSTCFGNTADQWSLSALENIISQKKNEEPADSYTSRLLTGPVSGVAQKLGEEAVELVIESMRDNDQLFLGEAADLLYHYLVLLHAKGFKLEDVIRTLGERNMKKD